MQLKEVLQKSQTDFRFSYHRDSLRAGKASWINFFLSISIGFAAYLDRTEEAGLILDASDVYSDPVHKAASFAVVDIDNDGWLDLYATLALGGNHLYVNQRDGRFVEEAARYGLQGPSISN